MCFPLKFAKVLRTSLVIEHLRWLLLNLGETFTAWKVPKYGVFSGPCFPVFGLNMEIYGVNLCIQSEYKKIGTRKYSVFGHFSCCDPFTNILVIGISFSLLNKSIEICLYKSSFIRVDIQKADLHLIKKAAEIQYKSRMTDPLRWTDNI